MKDFFNQLVSVDTHEELTMCGNRLNTKNGKSSYSIVKGVPIMLPESIKAKWHRELIEIILWEYPDEIEKIYKELKKQAITQKCT